MTYHNVTIASIVAGAVFVVVVGVMVANAEDLHYCAAPLKNPNHALVVTMAQKEIKRLEKRLEIAPVMLHKTLKNQIKTQRAIIRLYK